MPPGQRARQVSLAKQDEAVNQAITNLAEYGIVSVRRRRGGEITQVKVTGMLGPRWISAAEFGREKDLRDIQPYILEFIRAGYQFKAWIWQGEIPLGGIQVLDSDVTVPMGVALIAAWALLRQLDQWRGAPDWIVFLDTWWPLLPFGELWLFYEGGDLLYESVTSAANKRRQNVDNFVHWIEKEFTQDAGPPPGPPKFQK